MWHNTTIVNSSRKINSLLYKPQRAFKTRVELEFEVRRLTLWSPGIISFQSERDVCLGLFRCVWCLWLFFRAGMRHYLTFSVRLDKSNKTVSQKLGYSVLTEQLHWSEYQQCCDYKRCADFEQKSCLRELPNCTFPNKKYSRSAVYVYSVFCRIQRVDIISNAVE